jgi:hypothetical protein
MPLVSIVGLLALLAGTPAARAQVSPAPLTLPQYIQSLNNSLAAVRSIKETPENGPEVLRGLPFSWNVEVDGKTFEISAEPIRRDLETWLSQHGNESFNRAVQHLETLRDQAIAADQPVPDLASRRALLDSILARREFQNVHGQTWMERLQERINALLIKWLGRALSTSAIPVIGNILVYGLIVLAVLALAYWMYRSLREGTQLETIMPIAIPVSGKEWPLWIAEARAAATRGDWRDAIHLAYWGGISFLEVQGSWRPDVARTPREYLRLLPATSTHQPVLRSLTTRLEAVWYGMQAADAEGFEQTLAELERLGCACN